MGENGTLSLVEILSLIIGATIEGIFLDTLLTNHVFVLVTIFLDADGLALMVEGENADEKGLPQGVVIESHVELVLSFSGRDTEILLGGKVDTCPPSLLQRKSVGTGQLKVSSGSGTPLFAIKNGNEKFLTIADRLDLTCLVVRSRKK